MEWVIFALLSPAVYAVVNYIDKYIVSGGVADSRGMPLYTAVVASSLGTVYQVLFHPPLLQPHSFCIVLLAGFLTILSTAMYFMAMSREAASRIIIWLQLVPALVLPLSFFFLGETITPVQTSGFVIVLFSAVSLNLSLTPQGLNLKLSRASLGQILLADILWAVSMVLLKAAFSTESYSAVVIAESWGIGLGAIILCLLYPPSLQAFLESLKNSGKRSIGLIFINETGYLVGKLLGFLALTIGPASLVSVLGSTQVFFGLILGGLTLLVRPEIFQEDASLGGRVKDFIMASLMFLGIWLIYL